jgi:hypothetical protein
VQANLSEPGEGKHEPQAREERCVAPHPARAFLLSLPAFAIAIGIVLLLWKFLL